ncbi:MAG: alpha-L-arabinofuranosidase C-terminal domain-containing protein [Eubacteriales bacterium]|nr:alpha-L-arabinofuranosidase C-terminal domain-containing protein [Eubacteriales bacterium]
METIKIDLRKERGKINKELHSHFIEFLGGCIYDGLWVGEASEIPNYEGLRKDAVDALKKLEPPVIRWPGGCYADTYHWRNGIGPGEQRPVTYNENFGTYEKDSNQFGTHEFMRLCELVGAKPWLNINMMTGSPAEMRDWMEYCNREEPTALALERKANGAEKPFGVEFWGIGNEVWAGGGNMTPQSYANEYRKYASSFPNFISLENGGKPRVAMKRIASGPDGNKPKERVEWTKQFFEELGKFRRPALDGYDLHFYNWNLDNPEQKENEFDEKEWDQVIADCFELEDVILEQAELIRKGIDALPEEEGYFKTPKPACDLIVGEWGNWHGAAFYNRPALYQQCTMRDAITTALTLDIFHRNCETVKMACVAQTVNVLNSLILTDGADCILTPNYDVFEMYKVHREGTALETARPEDEKLHIFASVKGEDVYINLINADMTREKEVPLSFSSPMEFVSGQALECADPHDCNTKEEPDKIRAGESGTPERTEDGFIVKLKPASIQVLHFTVQK